MAMKEGTAVVVSYEVSGMRRNSEIGT